MTKAREIAELGQKLTVDASGNIDVNGSVTSNTLTVDTNITVGGTVDGRDVASDGTKLDGVEANADVTDTANVTAAGALMDSELTDITAVKALNQGVATTDDPTFTNTQLAAIAATISDTAVDIFVYDTRKDSDGGAWRKRTQHTSWYNETLNTATRGSRKEFPAVAVIVKESGQVTIYDGDDPDLPMWMVFIGGRTASVATAHMIPSTAATAGGVSMLNGKLITGNNGDVASVDGLSVIDFLTEKALWYTRYSSATAYSLVGLQISERNEDFTRVIQTGEDTIVNSFVNDVAMTVLPNAPIDAATGLPVPTIAVATDGGWSQISDDGNVYDFAFSTNPQVTRIGFKEYNGTTIVAWNGDSNDFTYDRGYFEHPLLSADKTSQTVANFDGSTSHEYSSNPSLRYPQSLSDSSNGNNYAIPNYMSNRRGVSMLDELFENRITSLKSSGMVHYVTADYATGWQNGAIKLATLSDTDATNVTGSELVTNGTFDSDLSGWTSSIAVWSSGAAAVGGSGGNGYIYQNMGLVTGQTYVITFDVTATTSPSLLVIQNSNSGSTSGGIYSDNDPPVGSYSVTFTASNSTLSFVVGGGNSAIVTLDNISVRLAEEDRSVNGNGLQVFGTVTKSAVATGADLVGYSGFSSSNYLQQPYNADLDFGTGDFCVMGWYKTGNSTTTEVLLSRVDSGNVAAINCMITSSETLILQTRESSTSSTVTTTETAATGVWNCFAFVRRNSGTVQEVYINGKLSQSGTVTARDVSSVTGKVYMGYTPELASNAKGSMALWRISATAPSPEQIKKIYEDEKVLFQEGAQATLYGSSDAVTALAYDDSTNLLHVGTSAGRSVFQGLKRVDNTTTAVGAAISASNGLVADE